jgi:phenylpyruvate tautomerase PptA (4-oxalocrotonate tautomerase family)
MSFASILIVVFHDRAVTTALAVQPAQVRVLLYELPPEHWAVGGQSKAAKS